MKICFVCLENLYNVPYLYKYTQLITEGYDIIYWNRINIDEDCGAHEYFPLNYYIKPLTPKINKIKGYLKFRKHATEILERKDYDIVILLNSTVAVLLNKILLKKYSRKYIVDIRDYSYEHISFFYNIEKKVVNNARKCVISSQGYKEFLPDCNYLLVHNSPNISKEKMEEYQYQRERVYNKNV